MHHGSCLCEAIRYSIDDALKLIVNCHCRFCRKAHGAPFTTVLFMPFAKLTLVEGKERLAAFEVATKSAFRCFCSTCGTRLYNHSPSTGMMSLVVATLDTTSELRPVAHVNTETCCPWWQINDELPRFSSMPDQGEWRRLVG